jgi:hypothetical protein
VNDPKHDKSVSPLRDLLGDWLKGPIGSWLDMRAFWGLRKRLLTDSQVFSSAELAKPEVPSPTKFAIQGLVFVSALITAVGWINAASRGEAVQNTEAEGHFFTSQERINSIRRQVDTFVNLTKMETPTEMEIEQYADGMVSGLAGDGLTREELETVLGEEQRLSDGAITDEYRKQLTEIEILREMISIHRAQVAAENRQELDVPLPNFVDVRDAIDDALDDAVPDNGDLEPVRIHEVAIGLLTSLKSVPITTAWLEVFLKTHHEDAQASRESQKPEAEEKIRVLKQAIGYLENGTGPMHSIQMLANRFWKTMETLHPLLSSLAVILAAYIFSWLIRHGQERPELNAPDPRVTYLYLVTSYWFWPNAVYIVFIGAGWFIAYHESWAFLAKVGVFAGAVVLYLILGIRALRKTANRMCEVFRLRRVTGFFYLYKGQRKIMVDLLLGFVFGGVLAMALGACVSGTYVGLLRALHQKL